MTTPHYRVEAVAVVGGGTQTQSWICDTADAAARVAADLRRDENVTRVRVIYVRADGTEHVCTGREKGREAHP